MVIDLRKEIARLDAMEAARAEAEHQEKLQQQRERDAKRAARLERVRNQKLQDAGTSNAPAQARRYRSPVDCHQSVLWIQKLMQAAQSTTSMSKWSFLPFEKLSLIFTTPMPGSSSPTIGKS